MPPPGNWCHCASPDGMQAHFVDQAGEQRMQAPRDRTTRPDRTRELPRSIRSRIMFRTVPFRTRDRTSPTAASACRN